MQAVLRSALSARLEILEALPEVETTRPPLLFVHGAFAGAWTFAEHFLPYFAAHGFPAYALSLRGHGESYGRDSLTWASLADFVDDLEETVRKRLEVYQRQTRPLVEYYQRWAASGEPGAPAYRRISGLGSVEEISARALAALA